MTEYRYKKTHSGWCESMSTVQRWMDKLCELALPAPELPSWNVLLHGDFLTNKQRWNIEKQRPLQPPVGSQVSVLYYLLMCLLGKPCYS